MKLISCYIAFHSYFVTYFHCWCWQDVRFWDTLWMTYFFLSLDKMSNNYRNKNNIIFIINSNNNTKTSKNSYNIINNNYNSINIKALKLAATTATTTKHFLHRRINNNNKTCFYISGSTTKNKHFLYQQQQQSHCIFPVLYLVLVSCKYFCSYFSYDSNQLLGILTNWIHFFVSWFFFFCNKQIVVGPISIKDEKTEDNLIFFLRRIMRQSTYNLYKSFSIANINKTLYKIVFA